MVLGPLRAQLRTHQGYHWFLSHAVVVQQYLGFAPLTPSAEREVQEKYRDEILVWARELRLYFVRASAPGLQTHVVLLVAVLVHCEGPGKQSDVCHCVHCPVSHRGCWREVQDFADSGCHRGSGLVSQKVAEVVTAASFGRGSGE